MDRPLTSAERQEDYRRNHKNDLAKLSTFIKSEIKAKLELLAEAHDLTQKKMLERLINQAYDKNEKKIKNDVKKLWQKAYMSDFICKELGLDGHKVSKIIKVLEEEKSAAARALLNSGQ